MLPVLPSQLITCHNHRACFIINGGNHLQLISWAKLGEIDRLRADGWGHFSQRRDRENALENVPLKGTRILAGNKNKSGNSEQKCGGKLHVNTTFGAFCCFERPVWYLQKVSKSLKKFSQHLNIFYLCEYCSKNQYPNNGTRSVQQSHVTFEQKCCFHAVITSKRFSFQFIVNYNQNDDV